MKKAIKIFGAGLILSVSGLAGCAGDNGLPRETDGREVDVIISAAQTPFTRTAYEGDEYGHRAVWLAGDKLGVFAYDTRSGKTGIGTNIKFDIDNIDNLGAASFRGTLTDPAAGAAFSAQYCAYYPWQYIASADPAALGWMLPATQYPSAATFDGSADLLLGKPVSTTAPVGKMVYGGETVPVNFLFDRPVAVTAMSFVNMPTKVLNDKVESVSFKAAGQKIAGTAALDLTQAEPLFAMGASAVDEVTLDYTSKFVSLTGTFAAWIVIAPVSTTSLEIIIETENFTIERTISAASALEFKGGCMNSVKVNLDEAVATVTDKNPGPTVPKADWINIVFTDDNAINMGSPLLPVVDAAGGRPVAQYDQNIKMWTMYCPGTDDNGTVGSGTNVYTTKNYYRIPYGSVSDFMDAIKQGFTMEVYCKALDQLDRSPFSGMESGGMGFRRDLTDGSAKVIRAHMGYSGGYLYTNYSQTNTTDFHHYMFTYDGTKIITYLNGVLQNTQVTDKVPNFPGTAANREYTLGGDTNNTTRAQLIWYGHIASARLYGYALTEEEVADVYGQFTDRAAITKFNDLNTALTVTIPAMEDGDTKDLLLAQGWALMNNIAATEAKVVEFLESFSGGTNHGRPEDIGSNVINDGNPL